MKNNEYFEELKKMAESDETKPVDGGSAGTSGNGEEEVYETPVMEIDTEGSREYSVKIQVKDMQKFILRHTYSNFSGWFGILISIAAIVMLCLGWDRYGNMEKAVLMALALLFTVIQPVVLLLRARKQVVSQEMFRIPLIYNICEKGIVVSQGEQKAGVLWDDISKVVESKSAVYVYTSPVRAFIFPKNQIGDVSEFLGSLGKE